MKTRKIVVCISPSTHHGACDGPSQGRRFQLACPGAALTSPKMSYLSAPGTESPGRTMSHRSLGTMSHRSSGEGDHTNPAISRRALSPAPMSSTAPSLSSPPCDSATSPGPASPPGWWSPPSVSGLPAWLLSPGQFGDLRCGGGGRVWVAARWRPCRVGSRPGRRGRGLPSRGLRWAP